MIENLLMSACLGFESLEKRWMGPQLTPPHKQGVVNCRVICRPWLVVRPLLGAENGAVGSVVAVSLLVHDQKPFVGYMIWVCKP